MVKIESAHMDDKTDFLKNLNCLTGKDKTTIDFMLLLY